MTKRIFIFGILTVVLSCLATDTFAQQVSTAFSFDDQYIKREERIRQRMEREHTTLPTIVDDRAPEQKYPGTERIEDIVIDGSRYFKEALYKELLNIHP